MKFEIYQNDAFDKSSVKSSFLFVFFLFIMEIISSIFYFVYNVEHKKGQRVKKRDERLKYSKKISMPWDIINLTI